MSSIKLIPDLHAFGAVLNSEGVALVNVSPLNDGNIWLLVENDGRFQSISMPPNVAKHIGNLILGFSASATIYGQAA